MNHRRARMENLGVCLSLANLCFLSAWQELYSLQQPDFAYFRAAPPGWTLLAATILDVLCIAGALWTGSLILQAVRHRLARWLGRSLFLFAVASVPVFAVFGPVADRPLGISAFFGVRTAQMMLLPFAALAVVDGQPRLFAFFRTAVLILLPAFPLGAAYVGYSQWQAGRAFQSGGTSLFSCTAPAKPARRDAVRVVWIVFDELDQHAVFEQRPAGVNLAQFDRLRSESLYATRAYPPAGCTLLSMPRLITGRSAAARKRVTLPWPIGESAKRWKDSVFSTAAEAGVNAAIVGYYHPYCRFLQKDVCGCLWTPSVDVNPTMRADEYARRNGVWKTMEHQAAKQAAAILRFHYGWKWSGPEAQELRMVREQQQHDYLEIHRRSLELAANPAIGLLLAHYPVPHPFGIYDRHRRQLSLNDAANYYDNLELADRTLGELRQALERAGLWDRTLVIVSSDHAFRPYVWDYRPTWTPEEEKRIGRTESPFIPCLLKAPGQRAGQTYAMPFDTILTRKIVSRALSAAETPSVRDVIGWLDEARSSAPKPQPAPPCF